MKGFIEIYSIDTETYFINISQIKYFYVPKFGDKFLVINLGNKEIKCKLSIDGFKKLIGWVD